MQAAVLMFLLIVVGAQDFLELTLMKGVQPVELVMGELRGKGVAGQKEAEKGQNPNQWKSMAAVMTDGQAMEGVGIT